jgi:hypothetical protein
MRCPDHWTAEQIVAAEQLSLDQQRVCELYYVDHLSLKQIAEQLGITRREARGLFSRSLVLLAQAIPRRECPTCESLGSDGLLLPSQKPRGCPGVHLVRSSVARDHGRAPRARASRGGARAVMTLAHLTACGTVRLTLELSPSQAAGLKRFAEKVTHADAMAVLYPQRPREQRADQAYEILDAFAALERLLDEAGVHSWPWIETGRP